MCQQQRICSYLGLKCSHKLSILSLPPSIRHQIYKEVDFIQDIQDWDVDLAWRSGTNSSDCEDELEFSLPLLQTNRTIYAEVLPYLYSTYRFFIHYRTLRSLQPLRNLSPLALASLRYLTIHLRVASCDGPASCCNLHLDRSSNCDDHDHDQPLDLSTGRDKTMLGEWISTAAYIFAHIPPSTLNFFFVCDVLTTEGAQLVLAPLLTAPLLASCAIRLARNPDLALQRLARETVTAVTSPSPDGQADPAPFPFFLLPRELCKHILSFTDLVSPFQEVQYSNTKRYHLHNYSTLSCGRKDCPTHASYACPHRNCWRRRQGRHGCFCSTFHTAFWTECCCWTPPTPIFLVSREMRDLAKEVFFGQNRFILVPEAGTWKVVSHLPERFHAEKFLRQVVPRDAMKSLRILEIVIPPFQKPTTGLFREWENTLIAVREELNVAKLTILVSFAEKGQYDDQGSLEASFRRNMTHAEAIEIYDSCMRIVKPLRQLEGLGRLFIKLTWPWGWTEWGMWRRQWERETVLREIKDEEQKIERVVMGERYDSEWEGKEKMGPSQWSLNWEPYYADFY